MKGTPLRGATVQQHQHQHQQLRPPPQGAPRKKKKAAGTSSVSFPVSTTRAVPPVNWRGNSVNQTAHNGYCCCTIPGCFQKVYNTCTAPGNLTHYSNEINSASPPFSFTANSFWIRAGIFHPHLYFVHALLRIFWTVHEIIFWSLRIQRFANIFSVVKGWLSSCEWGEDKYFIYCLLWGCF